MVGSWKVTSSCFAATPDAFGITGCPTAPVDLSKFVLTGSDMFRADKTEEMTEMFAGDITISFPSSCLVASGTTVDCDQVTASLADVTSSSDSSFSAVACRSGGGGCACDFTIRPVSMTNTFTYVTSGALLTETESDGTISESTYCVSGTTMTQHADGTEMMGGDGLSGTITLMKQ